MSVNSDVSEGAKFLVSCKHFECYKYVLVKSVYTDDSFDKDVCNNDDGNSDIVEKPATDRINISEDTMSFRSIIVIEGCGKKQLVRMRWITWQEKVSL